MQLTGLRIRHFRTIGDRDVDLDLSSSLTIVGPNNCGKTNILRAIEMMFTGHDNTHGYAIDRDLTFGTRSGRTSLLATFEGAPGSGPAPTATVETSSGSNVEQVTGPPGGAPEGVANDESPAIAVLDRDGAIYEQLDRLYELYEAERTSSAFTLSLVFSPSGNPVYQFFPNRKKPRAQAAQAAISRVQRQLVTDLLAGFSCHYIPSEKSIGQLYDEVLNPFLRSIAARAVEPQLADLERALRGVSDRVNDELCAVGLPNLSASFDLPSGGIESLLSRFSFNMRDPHSTPVANKGQGIQSTAFIAALRWVTEEERKTGRQTIWLLEEPESYLHPELMPTVHALLKRLSRDSCVITSTHSLAFVPSQVDRVRGVALNAEDRTEVIAYRTAVEAGAALRSALGVRFSDYYNLGAFNVAVEGPSDREMLTWYLSVTPESEVELPLLRQAEVQDHGGVKHLAGWLRATYPHIRHERALVCLFDGDDAGEKERRDLVGFLGGKDIPFQPNEQYVIGRTKFPIEALFPDEWLAAANEEHSGWFEDFVTDASGQLHRMKVKDSKKDPLQKWLRARAETQTDSSWRRRFDDVATALEKALAHQHARCSPDQPV